FRAKCAQGKLPLPAALCVNMIERLDTPNNFLGWTFVIVGSLILTVLILLLMNLPSANEISTVSGKLERIKLKKSGTGGNTLIVTLDGEKYLYSGFWSENVFHSVHADSEVSFSYYRAFDG